MRATAMDEVYWRRWARVYRAQASAQKAYSFNIERQQQAESLLAASRECDRIADELAGGE